MAGTPKRMIALWGVTTMATAFVLTLNGCTSLHTASATIPARVSLPVFSGWYAGERVYYITTEISDPSMAVSAGATYAPRLRDALPPLPRPPDWATVLERVYKFPQNNQDAVFASAPTPLGARSQDQSYSPLWIAYWVTWNSTLRQHPLLSEAMILDAESTGDVTVTRTDIVINCPIVAAASGDRLPGAVLH